MNDTLSQWEKEAENRLNTISVEETPELRILALISAIRIMEGALKKAAQDKTNIVGCFIVTEPETMRYKIASTEGRAAVEALAGVAKALEGEK